MVTLAHCSKASNMSLLSFLRPLALPRPSTVTRFLSSSSIARFPKSSASAAVSTPSPNPSTPSSSPSSASSSPTNTLASTSAIAKPYRVILTPSNQYPIYTLTKRGGNMKLTRVRKIEGDINALRTDLQAALGVDKKEVVVNQLTGHIMVKGHKRPQIVKFLEDQSQASRE